MHTVTIEIPDELSKAEVSLSIAKHLYEKELISAEQAAKVAGVGGKEVIESEMAKDRAQAWLEYQNRTARDVVEEQKRLRGYRGINKEELDRLRDELDIQEPFELLLSQLTR